MTRATKKESNVPEGELVQITKRRLSVDRVPRGQAPVYETRLRDDQEIIGVAYEFEHNFERRATVDHRLTIWVATRLGGTAP